MCRVRGRKTSNWSLTARGVISESEASRADSLVVVVEDGPSGDTVVVVARMDVVVGFKDEEPPPAMPATSCA